MVKKRKPAAKGVRRATQRRKAQAVEETPDPEAAPTSPTPSTVSQDDDHTSPSPFVSIPSKYPIIVHKKFGKYRCLTDENCGKKYEGSDSESSSVEVRVVDPCASSESDSNTAIELLSDSARNSPMDALNIQTTDNVQENSLLEVPSECVEVETVAHAETDVISENVMISDRSENVAPQNILLEPPVNNSAIEAAAINIPLQETEEVIEYEDDDDECITVVQIVDEDDYMDISYNNESPKAEPTEVASDFQENFQQLKIETSKPLVVECGDICSPNLQSCSNDSKEENLLRPDPSLTPSSTLSDDSNSSRALPESSQNSNDSFESSPSGVRRSSRIKTISTLKQKTKGYGLVKTPLKKALITQTKMKLEELGSDSPDKPSDMQNSLNSPSFPVPVEMPVKVKSRWRRSSELEMGCSSPGLSPLASPNLPQMAMSELKEELPAETATTKEDRDRIIEDRMKQYQHLEDNVYLCDRMISKDAKKMICDCFLTKEEIDRGELGCGEDCLNRLLMIECNYRCPVGDRCTNRRFEKHENALINVFYADKKGCGVEATTDISSGEFLMEYVGEVLDYELFYKRAQAYSDENNLHHYFMSLKGDTVIDATLKGNISRFINHSCEPNAETQKWTVNGELRIGFFSKRDIAAGEEITFDYQFQRFGKEAQHCYCGAENCRGWIGAEPDSDEEDEEEEEEDDVSTTKSTSTDTSRQDIGDTQADGSVKPRRKRRVKRDRKYVPSGPDLVQDADIEDDIEALLITGIKNQSHTLRLSRTMVRAKGRRAQVALLRLLRDADLPCRRLFLDYRGLRLIAPWCNDAALDFRWEMLQTVDRLPIPNKTIVQESRFLTMIERWLSSSAEQPDNNVFIDEVTGLPIELPHIKPEQDANEKQNSAAILEKVKELSKQLLERWSSLKEVFKIPKKERIQQMKEHEREANVERRAADSSGTRDRERRDERDRDRDRERDRERDRDRDREREREREKDREREREREQDREKERERERDRDRHRDRERDKERERERERERDRDRRKRKPSPEGRRSIRLSERVLATVPPMSKEERRRAFAEAAAVADENRRMTEHAPQWPYAWNRPPQDGFPSQMFPPGMMPGPAGVPGMMPGGVLLPGMPNGPHFCPPYPGPQPFCMPPNFMGIGGYPMGGYMFSQIPAPGFAGQPEPVAKPINTPEIPVNPIKNGEDVVLPSMWRSTVDDRGRTYYYHVKLRQPQWLPPPPPVINPNVPESSSSEEEEEPVVVTRRQPVGKMVEGVDGVIEVIKENKHNGLIPDHALVSERRKRRPGLVTERPISPRTEEDKLAGKLEIKRYKETKEKLRKKREKFLQKVKLYQAQVAKRDKRKHDLSASELKMIGLAEFDSDSDMSDESEAQLSPVEAEVDSSEARRIKENFRCNMARVMVQHLNPYRHSSAPVGRITSTADFKHLARKLTHFVMMKELKQCVSIQKLECTNSVKNKAKEFVKKYMAKFGPVYKRPAEEVD